MRPSRTTIVLFSPWITDSQDDNIALQTSSVNFETKREFTETSPGLKQELKAFFIDNASAGFGLFSKIVSKNFYKITQRAEVILINRFME